ncbi:MAG: BMP family ABC transporter substrate-binding protein [Spiroplasma sp.]
MKKIINFLTACFLILNSSMILIACRPPSLGEIWIITDGGDLFDKSFNQQVIEGAQEFTDIFNKNRKLISDIPGFESWKDNSLRIKWIISKDGTLSTLQNNYNIAGYAGAKIIICSGFHHISALTPEIQKTYGQLGVRFILVDSVVDNPINVAGLTYASEQSSFLAALAGAIWLVANHEKYGSANLKMSTFGGLASDVIVETMAGYYWGIYYFNKYKNINTDILKMINKIRKSQNNPEMSEDDLKSNKYEIIFDKLANSFSGGFESGTTGAKAITSQLINDNKNNIVFPVAGAQTTDLISTIFNSSNNNTAKIIGVDTDQINLYDYAKDYFITSALKGVAASVKWMLWLSLNLTWNKETKEISYEPNAQKYFNGEFKYLPLASKEYTGIANNFAIDAIYQDLMDNKYWNLANKVLVSFNMLAADLAKKNDTKKWDYAWINDIDASKDKYRPDF